MDTEIATPPRTPHEEADEQEHKEPAIRELLTHSIVDIYVGPDSVAYALHEKLLCHHSPVLRAHFYNSSTSTSMISEPSASGPRNTSYGLPDDEPAHFDLLVGWLYSRTLSFPVAEAETGPLLDLYLLADRLQMVALERDCVDTVRAFYHSNQTYPELRRVQYVYANTDEDNPMREMMVGSVARYLTLGEKIPAHWDRALRRNGQLAVDIIRAIQQWHVDGHSIPDARDGSIKGFSRIEGSSEVGDSDSFGRSALSDSGDLSRDVQDMPQET